MKKMLALFLALVMVLSLAACGSTASSAASSEAASPEAASSDAASSEAASSEAASETETAELSTVEPGKLIMSTNAAFPPYEMTTDSGEFEGIDIETAQAIADKLGLELQIDDMDFDAALLAVQQGKADMVMAGVTVTDERQNVMDFTDSYATGYLYCSDDFGDENVVAYDNGLTAVQMLNNGQVDCVVIDNAPAKEFIAANPGLKLLDTAYVEESYAIGVGKGNTELKDAINTALEELKADGTLQAIVDKYITAE